MNLRQVRVNKAMIVTSHFPFIKTFEDYDFSYQPRLNKDEILDLKNLRFIETNDNIVFMETHGKGKKPSGYIYWSRMREVSLSNYFH